MATTVTSDGKVHPEEHTNMDVTQTPQKDNDQPRTEPENDHVASPLDEPAPTDGKPFGQPK